MFNEERIVKALNLLAGQVEWIYAHRNLRDGLDIIFRVDGELRGLWLYQEERGRVFDAPQRLQAWRNELVVEPLSRERCLNLAAYFEASNRQLVLLTDAERREWQAIDEQRQREREALEARRQAEQERAERQQYQALKDKYSEGEK